MTLSLARSLRLITVAAIAGVLLPATAQAARSGTPGPDRIVLNGAAGTAHGAGGGDTLIGGPGDDKLYGEQGPDRLIGNGGADLLDGGAGDELLDGGTGNDTLIGDFGHDDVRGGEGDDNIYSDSGPDVIDAGPGNDTVFVNNGTAVRSVDCGDGDDTVNINPYGKPGGISNAQAVRRGQIRNCEHIVEAERVVDPTRARTRMVHGSQGTTLTGTDGLDNLLGSLGPDRIFGLAGDDVLWGNREHDGRAHGTDILDGGA